LNGRAPVKAPEYKVLRLCGKWHLACGIYGAESEAPSMAERAQQVSQDFWRPAHTPRTGVDSTISAACCANCAAEFALGARFCHVCGALREPLAEQSSWWTEWLNLDTLCEKLGLNLAALVLFAAACLCVLGAVLSGFIYRADTMREWQAVQTWRIEWMLASVVALLAALLLKKPAA
jgi:hypothetical protein